jgi:hypothetical protein
MIESTVISLPGTTPPCPSKQITDRGGEKKKRTKQIKFEYKRSKTQKQRKKDHPQKI